ncbi:hypothetical protein ACWEPC_37505 [Nonomuraea sp. NPDC004297]
MKHVTRRPGSLRFQKGGVAVVGVAAPPRRPGGAAAAVTCYIDQTYGNLLLTGMGCVQARARLDMVGQNVVATGQTRCLPQL